MPESEHRGPDGVGPGDPGLGPTQRQADLDRGGTLRPARTPTAPADNLSQAETIRGRKPGDKVFNARYELKRILGRGGMGVVWLAQDKELDHEVALKFLPEVMAYNEAAILELKRETKKALLLTHPHIVRIYGWERDAENAAVSMEYVDGQTLAALKAERESGCLEVADIREWVRQLCEALEYAHTKAKVVHRDLKPQNLMVNSKGDLKITDFGISRSLEESVTKTTRGGAGFSGTLSYMSPQQLGSKPSEPPDDIYALGATIYELLTGKPPFYGGDVSRLIREEVPPSMAERRKELGVEGGEAIPEAWEMTVAACLAKEPGQRPASAKAVWEGLMGAGSAVQSAALQQKRQQLVSLLARKIACDQTASPKKQPPESAPPRRPGGTGKWLALAAVLVLVGLGAWWLGPGRRGADSSTTPKGASNVVTAPGHAARATTGQVAQAPAKPDGAQVRREADLRAKPAPVRPAGQSFTNSLGMVFVPVPGTEVLFSIWETRVKDYAAYAAANSSVDGRWKDPLYKGQPVTPGPTHPAVNVSWEDAVAFCKWLTDTERKAGRLGPGREYRLPTDMEWSYAVGIGDQESGNTPKERQEQLRDSPYPWDPDRKGRPMSGNYADKMAGEAKLVTFYMPGYDDGFAATAPAGSFAPNPHGLFDLGGNVSEWCEDDWGDESGQRLVRGSSWSTAGGAMVTSSSRGGLRPDLRVDTVGFRSVLSSTGDSVCRVVFKTGIIRGFVVFKTGMVGRAKRE